MVTDRIECVRSKFRVSDKNLEQREREREREGEREGGREGGREGELS